MFQPDCYAIFSSGNEQWSNKIKRYFTKGYIFDVNNLIGQLQPITNGDTTFLEAYKRTGRCINITITNHSKYVPSAVLNYKTAPSLLMQT